MKKIYHLSACSTCQKILKELAPDSTVILQDIKEQNISADTLDWIKEKVGSYEALFSKRAMKYRGLGLDKMDLTENDYRSYLLSEYTFLKRPFMINGDEIFIGNVKKDVEAALKSFAKNT